MRAYYTITSDDATPSRFCAATKTSIASDAAADDERRDAFPLKRREPIKQLFSSVEHREVLLFFSGTCASYHFRLFSRNKKRS